MSKGIAAPQQRNAFVDRGTCLFFCGAASCLTCTNARWVGESMLSSTVAVLGLGRTEPGSVAGRWARQAGAKHAFLSWQKPSGAATTRTRYGLILGERPHAQNISCLSTQKVLAHLAETLALSLPPLDAFLRVPVSPGGDDARH
jgi:hypothetical protein